jgi:ribosome-associated translation inhibitor RaiA
MKLRIRVEEIALSPSSREGIEKRIRLALGTRTVSIDSVDVALTQLSNSPSAVRCQLSLHDAKGVQTFVEDNAEDLSSAVQWVIWRMIHFLDRRALREG